MSSVALPLLLDRPSLSTTGDFSTSPLVVLLDYVLRASILLFLVMPWRSFFLSNADEFLISSIFNVALT